MDNQINIAEKESISKNNRIYGIISLVLLALAALSTFLPAFKASFLGLNMSVSIFDILTKNDKYKIVFAAYVICLCLSVLPIVKKEYGFAKIGLVISGVFTIALPLAKLIALKMSDEGEGGLSSISRNLVNPDIGFYLMCIAGIAMIVFGCLLKNIKNIPQIFDTY